MLTKKITDKYLAKMTAIKAIFLAIGLLFLFSKDTSATPKEIYIDPDTGYEIWRMTNSSGNDYPGYYTSVPFSPNGKYVVYGSGWVMNADGTNAHTLSAPWSSIGEGMMGWWSHDSRYYFSKSGLYMTEIASNQSSQVPNSSQFLPFYYSMLSADGQTLSGLGNSGDISSGTCVIKFVNIDGTNYRSFTSPGRQSGGCDVTHGWLGNDAAWYLNNNQWGQYTDVPMVFNVNTGQFLGSLNVGNQTWDGMFAHPTLSDSAYMIGGGEGFIAGNGSRLRYANTKYWTSDATERQLTIIGSYLGDHTNFSPDSKWIVMGSNVGSQVGFVIIYAVPPPLSGSASDPIKIARYGTTSGRDYANASFSPDGTKVVFGGDFRQSGNTDLYYAIFKKPEKPTQLRAVSQGSNVLLTWEPANQHRETKEYEIHKATSQNGSYTKVATVAEVYTYVEAPSKISSNQTSINVDSTVDFPNQGVIEIIGLSSEKPTELVFYSGKTATSFTGLTRGYGGTAAAEHWNDSFVWLYRGNNGYTAPLESGAWYKVKSVEWSGVSSDLSDAVSVSGSATPIPTIRPTSTPAATPTVTPTTTLKTGDVNGDGKVDKNDLLIVLGVYISSPPSDSRADLNHDGKINTLDMGIVIKNFGR